MRSNRIDMLDLACAKWGKLENLDIAENGLGEIRELECLAGVVHLNLGRSLEDSAVTATILRRSMLSKLPVLFTLKLTRR